MESRASHVEERGGVRFVVELDPKEIRGDVAHVPHEQLPGVLVGDHVTIVDADRQERHSSTVVYLGGRDARLQLAPDHGSSQPA